MNVVPLLMSFYGLMCIVVDLSGDSKVNAFKSKRGRLHGRVTGLYGELSCPVTHVVVVGDVIAFFFVVSRDN